jgi:ABC-2 type transport system permease protein
MDASLDLSRWTGKPRGVGYRRWVIVSSGLRQLFRLRFFKILLAVAWMAGAAIALLGLAFGQSLTEGGWVETLANQFGPRARALASVLAGFLLLYPDICIGGFYTLVFWLHSFVALWLSLIAMTVVVPRLITRDRATHALIVYLARPLTSADYLLGKLGTIVGVLACLWTGPLLFSWVLNIAFAPNLDFVLYSFEPLGRALLFHLVGIVAVSAIALGVSALSPSSRNTIVIWVGLWVLLGFITLAPRTPVWLQRMSFTHNLTEVRSGILRPDAALIEAGEQLPLTNREFADSLTRAGTRTRTSDFDGALASLGGFVVLSSFVFLRRLRPE